MATVLINEVVGTAWVVNADGSRTQIQQGMRVPENAEIITENGARVVLNADNAPALTIGENREFALSPDVFDTDVDALAASISTPQDTVLDPQVAQVIAALEEGIDPFEVLDPTAAVLSTGGGDDAGGSSFTRLMSIIEPTTPLALAYPRPAVELPETQILGGTAPVAAAAAGPVGVEEVETPVVPEISTPVEPALPVEPGTPVEPVIPETEPELILVPGVVTLESPATMIEGEPYEIIARVDSPVTGTDLVIELSNGSIITIPVGESMGSVIVDSPRIDDAYIQGSIPETVTITGTTGGNYSDLDTSTSTTTVIKDDEDLSVVTLEGPDRVIEGQSYELIARVDNPVTGQDLIITLDNGQTITIPVGQSSGSVTIAVRADDNLVQGSETQSVGISSVTGGNYERLEFDSTPVTTTVLDNDMPQITVSDVIFSEGKAGTFEVGFGKPVDNDTTVTFHFEHDTTDEDDFDFSFDAGFDPAKLPVVMIDGQPVEGGVTYNPKDNTFSFTLPAGKYQNVTISSPVTENDDVFEGAEHFDLVVTQTGATKNGTLNINVEGKGQGTVVDDGRGMPTDPTQPVGPDNPEDPNNKADDDRPTLTIADVRVSEGDKAIFDVTLSNPIAANSTLKLNINTTPDNKVGFAGIDDLWESGDLGPIEIQTYGVDGKKLDIISVSPNTDGEYVVTFPELTTNIQVIIPTHGDDVYEGPETFVLSGKLSGEVGNVKFSDITDKGTGTIVDDGSLVPENPLDPTSPDVPADDDRPTLSIENVTVTEGEDEYAVFTVSLSNESVEDVTFDLALADDTATSTDYEGLEVSTDGGTTWTAATSATIVAGETELLVRTQILDDRIQESDESFSLTATVTDGTVKNAVAEDGSITVEAVGTIIDDDLLTLTVADAGLVSEGSLATFVVNLNNAVDKVTTMTLTLGHVDTEDADFDFDLPTITLPNGMAATDVVKNDDGTYSFTVPAGVSGAFTVVLPTQGDNVFEGPEDFTLTAELSGQTAGGTDIKGELRDSGEGTIVDDGRGMPIDPTQPVDPDTNPEDPNNPANDDRPKLTITGQTVEEGEFAKFKVELSNPVDGESQVEFDLNEGTADYGDLWESGEKQEVRVDIDGKSYIIEIVDGKFTVTVPEGVTSFDVIVPTFDDNIVEAAESFTLGGVLSGTVNGVDFESSATGTGTIQESDAPTLEVSDVTVSEGQGAEFVITIGGGEIPVATDMSFTLKTGTADFEDLWGANWEQDGARTVTVIVGEGDKATTHNVSVDTDGTFILEGVPAGTTKITVAVPTANDEVYEGEEKFTLDVTLTGTVEGDKDRPIELEKKGTGTIVDDGSPVDPDKPDGDKFDDDRPKLTVTGGGLVKEGSLADFTVTLSNPTKDNVNLSLTIDHISTNANDLGAMEVTYVGADGNTHTLDVNGGQVTVPAGITVIKVSVPTKDDNIDNEGAEEFNLVVTETTEFTHPYHREGTASATIIDKATDTVIEAGVGRGEDGAFTPDTPNNPYDGPLNAIGNLLTPNFDSGGNPKPGLKLPTNITGLAGSNGEPLTENTDGSWTLVSDYGTVTINPNGSYKYELDPANETVNELKQFNPEKPNEPGAFLEETFTYKVGDVEQTLTITIQGTNDRPEITSSADDGFLDGYVIDNDKISEGGVAAWRQVTEKGESNKDTYEDSDYIVNGTLEFSDVDSDGAQGTWSVVKGPKGETDPLEGVYGKLTLESNGEWIYKLENNWDATQALGDGDKKTEIFTVRITDAHGAFHEKNIIVGVQGTNDKPYVEDGQEQNITVGLPEDVTKNGSLVGLSGVEDREGDNLVVKGVTVIGADGTKHFIGDGQLDGAVEAQFDHSITLNEGELTIFENGNYTFKPTDNYSGPGPSISFKVGEKDGLDADVSTTVTLQVTPVADAPVINVDPSSGYEDSFVFDDEGKQVFDNDGKPVTNNIALGLKIPGITDSEKADGVTGDYDHPERLGSIGLVLGTGFKPGDVLIVGNGKITYEGDEYRYYTNKDSTDINDSSVVTPVMYKYEGVDYPSLQFIIKDIKNYHHTGATGIEISRKDFEGMTLQPQAHDGDNRTFGLEVTSYEVNGEGERLKFQEGDVNADGSPANAGEHIPGAPSVPVYTEIDIKAVTDPVDLKINEKAEGISDIGDDANGNPSATVTIKEDTSFSLNSALTAAFEDLDGSEKRWIEIKGLLDGSFITIGKNVIKVQVDESGNITGTYKVNNKGVVSNKLTKVDNFTIDATKLEVDGTQKSGMESFPKISITPPKDFSGEMNGVTVTLKAQDRDYDSDLNEDTPAGTANNPDYAKEETAKVELNFKVTPVVDGLEDTSAETAEDTAVPFLSGLALKDTDGSETLQSFKLNLSSLPEGAEIKVGDDVILSYDYENTQWVAHLGYEIVDGKVEILPEDDGSSDFNALAALIAKGFEITPPAHSSKDFTLKFDVTVADEGAGQTDTESSVYELPVTVTPVAEKVGEDTDGDKIVDLTMNDDHTYEITAKEDGGKEDGQAWFALGTDVDLAGQWKNQDGGVGGSEKTYALLTPEAVSVAEGDSFDPQDALFRYKDADHSEADDDGWVYVKYGQVFDILEKTSEYGFKIPVEFLNTAEFMAPKDVAGEFKISVKAYTEDFGEDANDVKDTAISGQAWLKGIVITPVADDLASFNTNPAEGLEDEAIELKILPKESDASETVNIRISVESTDGAELMYGGDVLVAKDGYYEIIGFNAGTKFTITPRQDSNESITLEVGAQTVDTWEQKDENGDVVKTHSDSSEWVTKDLHVTVKGVADGANVTMEQLTGDDALLENTVDENSHEIAVTSLVKSVISKDTDGSETMTYRITGLPEGFEVVGANATLVKDDEGEARIWAFDSLEGVSIKVPEHFSGKLPGQFGVVSTENDGDKTESIFEVGAEEAVKDDWLPFEATVRAELDGELQSSNSIDEDKLGKVEFKYESSDDSESLTGIYLHKDDIQQLTNDGFTLYVGETQITVDSEFGTDGYYVEKVDPDSVTMQAAENKAHNIGDDGKFNELSFTFESLGFEVTQTHWDKSKPATIRKDGTHTVTVRPITDDITIKTQGKGEDGKVVATIAGASAKFDLNVSSKDYDGSERLTKVEFSGVPNGAILDSVTINEGTSYSNIIMTAPGEWVLYVPESDAKAYFTSEGGFNVDLSVKTGPYVANVTNHKVTVTVTSHDKGAENTVTKSTDVYLTTTSGTGGGDDRPTIEMSFEAVDDAKGTEDKAFFLGSVISSATMTVENTTEEARFSIVVGLPKGASIDSDSIPEGVVLTQDGDTWIISGIGQTGLNSVLNTDKGVQITPPKDWNIERDGALKVGVALNGYLKDSALSDSVKAEQPVEVELTPVTDGVDGVKEEDGSINIKDKITFKSVNGGAPKEGENIAIKVELSNSKDAPLEVIDHKVYVTVKGDGELFLGNEVLQKNGDGKYEISVEKIERSDSLDLIYVPTFAEAEEGKDFNLEVTVNGAVKEQGSDKEVGFAGENKTGVEVINNGFIFVGNLEVQGTEVVEGKKSELHTQGAVLNLSDTGSRLKDGTEKIFSAMIEGLPEGFLVYVGGKLALNTGDAWLISGSGIVDSEVKILPPQNWNGTLGGLKLTVNSGETSTTKPNSDTTTFTLVVEAHADGIRTLAPEAATGIEGDIVDLNLNLSMKDWVGVQDKDNPETATISLTGLGQYAAFYTGKKDGDLITTGITYDKSSDTYILTGLSQEQINNLGFRQAANAVKADGKIYVDAFTEDGDNKSTWFGKQDFTVNLKKQAVTDSEDDVLYTGEKIAGLESEDTVFLRLGENLNLATDAENIAGVGTIDITRFGHSNGLSGFTKKGMETLLGKGGGVLTIKANGNDMVDLSVADGFVWRWSSSDEKAGEKSNTYTLYSKTETEDGAFEYESTSYSIKLVSPEGKIHHMADQESDSDFAWDDEGEIGLVASFSLSRALEIVKEGGDLPYGGYVITDAELPEGISEAEAARAQNILESAANYESDFKDLELNTPESEPDEPVEVVRLSLFEAMSILDKGDDLPESYVLSSVKLTIKGEITAERLAEIQDQVATIMDGAANSKSLQEADLSYTLVKEEDTKPVETSPVPEYTLEQAMEMTDLPDEYTLSDANLTGIKVADFKEAKAKALEIINDAENGDKLTFAYTLKDTADNINKAPHDVVSGAKNHEITDTDSNSGSTDTGDTKTPEYTLEQAMKIGDALEGKYTLSNAKDLSVAEYKEAQGIISSAENSNAFTYTLKDTLAHLKDAADIVNGAKSYALTDESFDMETLESGLESGDMKLIARASNSSDYLSEKPKPEPVDSKDEDEESESSTDPKDSEDQGKIDGSILDDDEGSNANVELGDDEMGKAPILVVSKDKDAFDTPSDTAIDAAKYMVEIPKNEVDTIN